uniref:Uncharacterized protein n=1 Tax=Odontella aurita TaxID=265563 RepID=A0A6U6HXY2_9STRA
MSFADVASSRLSSLLGVSENDANDLIRNAMEALGIEFNDGQDNAMSDAVNSNALASSCRMEAVLEIAVSAHFSRSESTEEIRRNTKSKMTRGSLERDHHTRRSAVSDEVKSNKPTSSQATLGSSFGTSSTIKTQRTISSLFSGRKRSAFGGSQAEAREEKVDQINNEDQVIGQEESISRKVRRVNSSKDHLLSGDVGGGNICDSKDVIKNDGVEEGSSNLLPEEDVVLDFLSPRFDAFQLARSYCVSKGGSPPFLHLAKALAQVCSTTKRLEKDRILTNIFLTFLYYDRMVESLSNNSINGSARDSGSSVSDRIPVLHFYLMCENNLMHLNSCTPVLVPNSEVIWKELCSPCSAARRKRGM